MKPAPRTLEGALAHYVELKLERVMTLTKFQGWLALALLGLIATALWYPLVGENVFIGAAILLGAAFVAAFTVKFFKAEK